MKRLSYIFPVIVLFFALSGCTVTRFEPIDEAKAKEEDKNLMTTLSQSVDPAEYIAEDLKMQQELKSAAGVLLAQYDTKAPQFRTDGAKSTVFTNVNQFYSDEFSELSSDCERFFSIVKQQTGARWNDIQVAVPVQICTFGYQLLSGNEKMLNILRTYTSDDGKGNMLTYNFADSFDLETGWKLKFSDVFPTDTQSAKTLVKAQVSAWCEENKLPSEGLDSMTEDQLIGEFTLDGDDLLICLAPFALSADDNQSRIVRLNMSDFEKFLHK